MAKTRGMRKYYSRTNIAFLVTIAVLVALAVIFVGFNLDQVEGQASFEFASDGIGNFSIGFFVIAFITFVWNFNYFTQAGASRRDIARESILEGFVLVGLFILEALVLFFIVAGLYSMATDLSFASIIGEMSAKVVLVDAIKSLLSGTSIYLIGKIFAVAFYQKSTKINVITVIVGILLYLFISMGVEFAGQGQEAIDLFIGVLPGFIAPIFKAEFYVINLTQNPKTYILVFAIITAVLSLIYYKLVLRQEIVYK